MSLRADANQLVVHWVATEVAADVVRLAKTFRGPGAGARGNQIVRASLSISSNIAEACGRGTQREFQRFIAIAQGSTQELLSQLRVARRIGTASNGALAVSLENRTALILKMLGRLHANPPPPRQPDASA